MALKHITEKSEFDHYMEEAAFVLLKHSNTCPISASAYNEFVKFTEANSNFPAVYLVVQEDRDLSAEIAETYHVKHESPQVIVFKNGSVAYHTSHYEITADSLEKAIQEQ